MIELFTLVIMATAPCQNAQTDNCQSAVMVFTDIATLDGCAIEGENMLAALNPFKADYVAFEAVCEFQEFQAGKND